MNKEKQIEEMAKVIASVPPIEFPIGSRKQGRHIYTTKKIAEHLYTAGYRKQEWISVEEMLPEDSGEVLAYTTLKTYITLHYSAKHKLFNSYDDDSRSWAERYCVDVTHWMPLPEAPKMKGGAE